MRTKHLFICLLGVLASPTQALNPTEIFSNVKSGIVVVVAMDAKGEPAAFGSGVYLPSGKIATNCHVLDGAEDVAVTYEKKTYPASLYGGDEDRDICLLSSPELKAKAVTLGRSATLNVGDQMFAIGAPKGLELTMSDGIVSALRGGFPPMIQTTAAISRGSSGGGLFDANGHLVGITTLYMDDAQNLNFAAPVEWIADIKPIASPAVVQTPAAPPAKALAKNGVDWFERAKFFSKQKKWPELLTVSRQWQAAEPDNFLAWLSSAVAYREMSRYHEAIQDYSRAIDINPDDSYIWLYLGNALAATDQLEKAVKAFKESVSLDPENTQAWFMLALVQRDLEYYTAAAESLRTVLRAEPEDAEAWIELGFTYEFLKQPADATSAFEQAYRLEPNNAYAVRALANNHQLNKRYALGLSYAKLAVKLDPSDIDGYIVLGNAYLDMKDNKSAIINYLKVLSMDVKHENTWFNIALAYHREKRFSESLQAAKSLQKLNPAEAARLYKIIDP